MAWTNFVNIWSLVKAPVTLFLMLMFLSAEQQGIWYTFTNLAALSIFADLGFTLIISQFVSHEYSRLTFAEGRLAGKTSDIDRLVSLARYAVRFYCVVILLAILALCVVGFFYFSNQPHAVLAAWVAFSVVGGFSLFLSLLQSIYRGLDQVANTQRAIFVSSVITSISTWVGLGFGLGIFALPVGASFGAVALLYCLWLEAPQFWLQLRTHRVALKIGWASDIIWLQGKYAVTFASGYFIFNLIVPAIFKLEGAVVAGQLGLTIAMTAVIQNFALAGVTARVPKANMLIASNRWLECVRLIRDLTSTACALYLMGGFLLMVGVWVLERIGLFSGRLLSFPLLFLVLTYQLSVVFTSGASTFLRAQKKEPHMPIAIVQAFVIGGGIIYVLPQYGLYWMLVTINLAYWMVSVLPIFWMARSSLHRHEHMTTSNLL